VRRASSKPSIVPKVVNQGLEDPDYPQSIGQFTSLFIYIYIYIMLYYIYIHTVYIYIIIHIYIVYIHIL
jgi:hypothetical protein